MKKLFVRFGTLVLVLSALLLQPYAASAPTIKYGVYEPATAGYPQFNYPPIWVLSRDTTTGTGTGAWEDYTDSGYGLGNRVVYGGYWGDPTPRWERDYTWFGPTTADPGVEWNAGLGGWSVPAGSHALYPTRKNGMSTSERLNLREPDASDKDGWKYAFYDYMGIVGANDPPCYAYEYPNGNLRSGYGLHDQVFAANGGEISQMQEQSQKGLRIYNKHPVTWTYNTTGAPMDPFSLTFNSCDKVFGWQKYVVTVTGSGGSSALRTSKTKIMRPVGRPTSRISVTPKGLITMLMPLKPKGPDQILVQPHHNAPGVSIEQIANLLRKAARDLYIATTSILILALHIFVTLISSFFPNNASSDYGHRIGHFHHFFNNLLNFTLLRTAISTLLALLPTLPGLLLVNGTPASFGDQSPSNPPLKHRWSRRTVARAPPGKVTQ